MHWRRALGFAIGLILLLLLYLHDPENGGFPPCPFRSITGLLCPGCGSQRALHDLLHGHITEAFGHNALMVLALPLLGAQWSIGRLRNGPPPAASNIVVTGWLVAIVAWGVLRNL